MEYLVRWEIELDAEDPLSAAQEALRIFEDPDSTATIFVVSRSVAAGASPDPNLWVVDIADHSVIPCIKEQLSRKEE